MINILNLIRWKNLLLIALTQVLIKHALFHENLGANTTLSSFNFSLLVIATLCIAAAGYVINDIYDVEIDTINVPERVIIGNHISEKAALNIYIVLSFIGVGLGFYLSNVIDRSGFAIVFIIISALLYVYTTYFKHMVLIGNIIVSIIVAMPILILGVFELLPAITEQNQQIQVTFFKILIDYAIFAFMINFLREIVKDIEDVNGDYNADMKTLPIILGRERTGKVVFALSFIPIFAVSYYVFTYLYKQPIAVGYFLIFIVAPLLYFSVKSFTADSKKEWHHLSTILKITMLFGVLSLLLYKFILS